MGCDKVSTCVVLGWDCYFVEKRKSILREVSIEERGKFANTAFGRVFKVKDSASRSELFAYRAAEHGCACFVHEDANKGWQRAVQTAQDHLCTLSLQRDMKGT